MLKFLLEERKMQIDSIEHGLVRLAASNNSESLEFLLDRLDSQKIEEILTAEDDDGNNIFHIVAASRNLDSLSILLGFDSLLVGDALQHVNADGNSALHLACQSDWENVCRLFFLVFVSFCCRSDPSVLFGLGAFFFFFLVPPILCWPPSWECHPIFFFSHVHHHLVGGWRRVRDLFPDTTFYI